jgi:tRNA(Ile)-lysidine synthase
VIVPSEAPSAARRWSPDHQRLHRHLLHRPSLLPAGAPLLVAVSGGQDSMALCRLLLDLRPLHGWRLHLWHGDHGWRTDSAAQADALAAWAARCGLAMVVERAERVEGGQAPDEAAWRAWRYRCLEGQARVLGCGHVVTGHTASDRAETVLLNLARGSHRRGLASLRASRPLTAQPDPAGGGARGAEAGQAGLRLVRPLLIFSRRETACFCRREGVPVWTDASNEDPRFARNRVRAEVLPVLECLHPGATRRISALAGRLAEEEGLLEELGGLALAALEIGAGLPAGAAAALRRQALARLSVAGQRRLLQAWLVARSGRGLAAAQLEELVAALAPGRPPGRRDLAGGWRLLWDRRTLALHPPDRRDG